MSTFDVFINGIQPAHVENKQTILAELAKRLQVDTQRAEKIIKTPNTRVSQSVPIEQAEKVQQSFHKIGVICVYRPNTETTSLSLEPIDEQEEGALKACPNCNHKFSNSTQLIPEKCNNCGVFLEKFMLIDNNEKEKEEIRKNLIQKDSIRVAREQQIKDEQTAEIRKKLLEQEVLRETPYLNKRTKNKLTKQNSILLGGTLLISAVAGVSYTLMDEKNNSPSPTQIVSSPEDELATIIPESSENIGSAQDALQNTHDQAAQVLDAFGLDADAFANAGTKNSAPSNIELPAQSTPPSTPSITNPLLSASNITSKLLPPFLLELGTDEKEWNYYLTHQAEKSISKNNFSLSQKIISHLPNTEKFINLSGKLLNKTQQSGLKAEINSTIETRIKSSPLELHAQYSSLAAANQKNKETSDFLFNRAENSWKTISNPNRQLLSALKIAVSHFKADNSASANRYFDKINPLLSKITSTENQITARIATSQAFQDVGQHKIALNWLGSTNKYIKNSNKSSLQEIIKGYAYLDQIDTVEALTKQASTSDRQDELLYIAARTSLNSKLNRNAISLVNLIENPTNKALSYTLLASYLEDNLIYLTSAESLATQDIQDPNHKAIVLSRIAQQYARQKNTIKVSELFKQTEDLITLIPSSPEKDKLLNIIITNLAGSTKQESAKALLSYVQSPTIKGQINEIFTRRSRIMALIKQ